MKSVTKSSGFFTVLSVTALCLLLTALLPASPLAPNSDQPRFPDEERLASLFSSKRPLFEQIADLASQEKVTAFYVGKGDADSSGLPTERIHEYRRLSSLIDAHVLVSVVVRNAFGDRTVQFIFECGGNPLAIAPHWSNGILFISDNTSRYGNVVKRAREIDLREDNTFLIPLEQRWFIFHDQT